MKARLTRNDYTLLVIIAAALAIGGAAAWRIWGDAAVVPLMIACTLIVLAGVLAGVRRTSEQLATMRKEAFDDYRQVEALLSLHATLKPDFPLPQFRDFTASPDLLQHAVSLIIRKRPQLMVELGSGSSTVVLAQCLEKVGAGRLLSIEHEGEFAERTRRMLAERGLSDRATVIHCPLEKLARDGREYFWYSLDHSQIDAPIDFLFIDGPPYHVHPLARYPALPVLAPLFAESFSVLLDDAIRPEEERIIEMWKREFSGFRFDSLPSEKGAVLIEKYTGS